MYRNALSSPAGDGKAPQSASHKECHKHEYYKHIGSTHATLLRRHCRTRRFQHVRGCVQGLLGGIVAARDELMRDIIP